MQWVPSEGPAELVPGQQDGSPRPGEPSESPLMSQAGPRQALPTRAAGRSLPATESLGGRCRTQCGAEEVSARSHPFLGPESGSPPSPG